MFRSRKTVLYLFICISLTGLMACSGLETREEDRGVLLQHRLAKYLAARQNADKVEMQKYYLDQGRVKVGNIVYKKSETISFIIDSDGQTAETKLQNTIQAMGFTFNKVPQTLSWVWHDDNWFLIINESSADPFRKSQEHKIPMPDKPKK